MVVVQYQFERSRPDYLSVGNKLLIILHTNPTLNSTVDQFQLLELYFL
jgi:hypothetical protein